MAAFQLATAIISFIQSCLNSGLSVIQTPIVQITKAITVIIIHTSESVILIETVDYTILYIIAMSWTRGSVIRAKSCVYKITSVAHYKEILDKGGLCG